ncbi:MAG: penicillin-binding transpeptidase domain-containing protein [Vicinamibacterales bacterium]
MADRWRSRPWPKTTTHVLRTAEIVTDWPLRIGATVKRAAASAGQLSAAARAELPPALAWRATLQSRLLAVALIFAVWTIGIEARLFYLQVVEHSELTARADRQQLDVIDVPAKRGEILDRHGRVLAYSVDADTVYANPMEVLDPDETAARVCGALDACDASTRHSMAKTLRKRTQFAYLARKVSPDEAKRVKALQLKGVAFLKENRRYYPKKELAAHVLGYVGTDNVGLAGLESTYDAQIRGKDGKVLVTTDARQHALFSRVDRAATAGAGLELTIDQFLQHIAERELRTGVAENHAAGGSAVIMDPRSGEILALANWPTFNPNSFLESDEVERRNRAIQDLYEPGSTFKLVTASAALEERVMKPQDPVDCAPGFITFPGRPPIRDVHAYGVLPFADVIVKSSNVGAIRVGLRLGPERLNRYIDRFGFGRAIAPDFRGESPGIVWDPAKLDASALASVSMGYQIAVTPVQMAAAASSIANGGTLIEPRVVRAVIKDGRRTIVQPRVVRRTVSTETAAELTAIMEDVVERGTARSAQIDGYTIAGKTGTAAKLVGGHYSKSEYNASFVGFLPSRNPVLTIIVVIDSPHGAGYMGGVVAAPVFKRIAEAALRQIGVPPNIGAVPPVLVARHEADSTTMAPHPVANGPDSVSTAIEATEPGTMPDLRGLAAREAVNVLTRLGMTARMNGSGFVAEQSPEAGEPVVAGEVSVLTLGRRPPVLPARGLQ